MKTQRLTSAFLLAGALLLAGPARVGATPPPDWRSMFDAQQRQTEKFSKSVPLAKGGMLDLSNVSGDITITGGSGDQVVIDATKRGRTTEELKEVTIEVTTTANRVEVRTRYPENRHNISVSVDFTVTVPKWASVNVRSVSGNEKISTVDGELQATTVSGNVGISSVADLRNAKSVSGNVTVETAVSTGMCSAKSISGNLTLRNLKAHELQADTISGDAKLEDVTTERATAKSISGDLSYSGLLAKGGRYEFSSHSGNMSVYTSDKVGFEVSASTFSGSIRSDLPLTTKGASETGRSRGWRMGERLQATFGDGSAMLQLNSFSGDIRIVKK